MKIFLMGEASQHRSLLLATSAAFQVIDCLFDDRDHVAACLTGYAMRLIDDLFRLALELRGGGLLKVHLPVMPR